MAYTTGKSIHEWNKAENINEWNSAGKNRD